MSDRRRLTLTRRRALGLTAGLGLGSLTPSFAFGTSASPGPQYPKGQQPRLLNVLTEDSLSPAERTLATTLQGLMARSGGESLYLNIPSLGYQFWLDDLVARYGVVPAPVSCGKPSAGRASTDIFSFERALRRSTWRPRLPA